MGYEEEKTPPPPHQGAEASEGTRKPQKERGNLRRNAEDSWMRPAIDDI